MTSACWPPPACSGQPVSSRFRRNGSTVAPAAPPRRPPGSRRPAAELRRVPHRRLLSAREALFVQDALNVHVRAHRLSRRAGPQPGQRGYVAAGIETMLRTARTLASGHDLPTVVGKAFRQLAAFGAASLQAALAPII